MIDIDKFLESVPEELSKGAKELVDKTLQEFKTLRELKAFNQGLQLGIAGATDDDGRIIAMIFSIALKDRIDKRQKEYDTITRG